MYITLDIGGTKCRVARFDGLTKGSLKGVVNVEVENNWQRDFYRICEEIWKIAKGGEIRGVAIGIAGSLNKEKNKLENSVNLNTWQGIDLKMSFKEKFSCNVYIENDTFMAGFGEAVFGRIKKDFLYISWGTGVGGCLVNFVDYENRLLEIRASELGHQLIIMNGIKCRCGQKGCLDAYVGGRGIESLYGKSAMYLTQKEWQEVVKRMAVGIMNALVVYPVEYVVMGGGITLNQFENIKHLEEIITKKLKIIPPPRISIASLDDYAGLYGGIAYIEKIQHK